MAVRLEGSIKRFIGESRDEKPIPGQTIFDPVRNTSLLIADIPAGSSFLETDTGIIWRWTGYKWSSAPADESDQVYVLEAILVQLTELRQMVALTVGD